MDEIAAEAAAAAALAAGKQLSEADRKLCTSVAFDIARSVLKGGAPAVPDRCRAMADAARSQFAYYAGAHIDAGNAGVQELLAYLNMRDPKSGGSLNGDLGRPAPGLEGLSPFPQKPTDAPKGATRPGGGASEKACAVGFVVDSDGDCVREKAKKDTAARRTTPRTERGGSDNARSGLDCTNPAGLFACANRALSTPR